MPAQRSFSARMASYSWPAESGTSHQGARFKLTFSSDRLSYAPEVLYKRQLAVMYCPTSSSPNGELYLATEAAGEIYQPAS